MSDDLWTGYRNSNGSVPSWALALVIEQNQETIPVLDFKSFAQWGPWGVVTALMFAVILAVLRGYWVPGSYYKAMKDERDQARLLAADATKVSERLTAGWKPPQ